MKRTTFMSLVLENTYSQVAINALILGSIEGAWEKAIAERLEHDFRHHCDLVHLTMRQLGFPSLCPPKEEFLKAAYLIRATEPETVNP
jgi:hypothetical protein